ncbi:MAG: helix-turn-helix transcriptional regulator, partial [Oscillospiraceae bacterium]
KETTGETFPAYINRLRLSRARELLLLEKSFTIEKIAESVGFYSASYFTAAFKKQYGISPSQARRYDTVRAQMPDTGKEESS